MLLSTQSSGQDSPRRLRLAGSGGLVPALVVWMSWGATPDRAEASPSATRVTYETSGTIDASGVTGTPVVRFVGGTGSTATASPFPLGAFQVDPANTGAVTRYSQTPVTISYWTQAVNGTSTAAQNGTPASPMVIHGWLSGTVGGANASALSVLFDQGLQPDDPRFYQPRPLPPFPAGASVGENADGKPPGYLSLNGGQSLLTLNPAGGAMTPVAAAVDLTASVPEPTSVLVFLAGAAALGLARRRPRR